MRYVILLMLVAAAVAEIAEEPWAEEEELEEPYDEYEHERQRRDVHDDGPYEEHVRVKRCEEQVSRDREKRSERTSRQVPNYDIREDHEHMEETAYPAPPYEEMLAASAEHYHMYQAPGAPEATRYTEVSPGSFAVVRPLSDVQTSNNPNPAYANSNVGPAGVVSLPPVSQQGPDLAQAAGHHRNLHHRGHENGGGRSHHAAHHSGRGGKSHKGYSSDHYVDKGNKGFKTDHKHSKEYEEASGKKKKHHDNANHKATHEEEAQGSRGSKFAEKKGHKKGHKTKGYHNKYHKDEFHKEHKFYDDFHKSGEHHRYGNFNAKHESNEKGKKKAHRVNAGHDSVERGKKGYTNKGHVDDEHKSHRSKSGHEDHYAKHSQSGKKNGKQGGTHWGYSKN